MSKQSSLIVSKAPRGPRAMAAADEDMKDENVGELEKANLLYGIHPFQGLDRVDSEGKKFGNRGTPKMYRHSFLDNICYLCDVYPQGGTVTAGALNQISSSSSSSGAILYLSGKVLNMEVLYAAPLLQFSSSIDEWHHYIR